MSYLPPFIATFLLLTSINATYACSSRTTPKPRPPPPPPSVQTASTTTPRPNITFHTYKCPSAYAAWYCLNDATCFTVKIGESLLYNCECADGYMGPRCEYKDLDGSYLPTRPRVMLEKASIASGVMLAIVMMVILVCCWLVHKNRENKRKFLESSATNGVDTVDSVNQRRPFAGDYRQISMEDAFVRHN